MIDVSNVQNIGVVHNKKHSKDVHFTLVTLNSKMSRIITDSFSICKVANGLSVKKTISELNNRIKDGVAEVVLVDADCYPNEWVDMVGVVSDFPSVKMGGVVVLSSFGDTDILTKAKMAGASEFVVKPFDIIGAYQLITKLPCLSLKMIHDETRMRG